MSNQTDDKPGPEAPTFHGPAFPSPAGWICPRCGASNAPGNMRCACSPVVPPCYPPVVPYPSHPHWPQGPYVGDWPPTQPMRTTINCCRGPR